MRSGKNQQTSHPSVQEDAILQRHSRFTSAPPRLAAIAAVLFTGVALPQKATASGYKFPELFLLGDSQLSFGAGRVFHNFFQNFETHCAQFEPMNGDARRIASMRSAVMGVKATSIHTWVARRWRTKRMICVPDPKWPVNARLYGIRGRQDGTYVQLGKDPKFPFCRQKISAFEAMFAQAANNPKLLLLYFMGNSVTRWANNPKSAQRDVDNMMRQLPATVGCVFMTTAPTYRKRDNDIRARAQKNIVSAFASYGRRCAALGMITRQTRAAIEGNSKYFRRAKSGRVKDPYHTNGAGAARLIKLRRPVLCRAVFSQLQMKHAVAGASGTAQR